MRVEKVTFFQEQPLDSGMERTTKALLVAAIAFIGALVFLALAVYPFQYGPVQSAVLAGLLVLVALFETVLEGSSF